LYKLIFIANSKQKKFKKLFLLSRILIKQYGFRYFFRIAFEEFFKQKRSLFTSDIMPKLDFKQFTTDYEIFKQKHMLTPLQVELIKNKLLESPTKPSFTFLLINFENTPSFLPSLHSVLNQIYQNFDLTIINCSSNIIDLNDFEDELKFEKIQFVQNIYDSKKLSEIISLSKGDFIAILDANVIVQNDLLYRVFEKFYQNSDSDIFYTDEDFIDNNNNRINPFFKPDWSSNLFFSMNYLGQFCIIKKSILEQIKEFTFHTSQDFFYDLILKCTELTENISHIPLPLFSTNKNNNFTYSKSIKLSLIHHFEKIGIDVDIRTGIFPNTYRVNYKLDSEPKVSIIIPTKDKKELLSRCIQSIEKNTTYKNWEIIIIDNNSTDEKTINYFESLPYLIIRYDDSFNFSKMNNLAVKQATGDYLLFLNDDTAALEDNWLTEMVSICQQKNVGIVGPKLIHSDDTIQHAGMVFLKSGAGFHPFQRFSENDSGYFNSINVIRDFSAVTGACLLIKKSIFSKVNGFDDDFDLYYGDADLCLKVRSMGLNIVYTPYSKLLHEGSTSIKKYSDAFFTVENHYRFAKKWSYLKNGDPFYNPNLGWNYSMDSA
jgi:O-antigen biosynthesis protein